MGLSQEQLANISNVSRTVIAKIESGKRNPTQEQLIILSNKLNFDLLTFEDKAQNYKTLEHYLLVSELTELTRSAKNNEISEIINNNPTFYELNYGEPAIIRTYCEILNLITVENNIEQALEYCLDFFEIENLDIKNFRLKIGMPEQYYSIILTLSYCLNCKNDFDNEIILQKKTIDFLESLYFNRDLPFIGVSHFSRKFYIICLNNIADTYFEAKDFEKSLNYCNKGIKHSAKLNISNVLPQLTKLKVEVLYNQNKFDEAKEMFNDFKAICRLNGCVDYFEKTTNTFKTMYPKIFNE